MTTGAGSRRPVARAEPRAVLGTYNYVEGAGLTALILEVREEFVKRLPYDLGDGRRPNSVHAVALDVYDAKAVDTRLAILRDLLDGNDGLFLERAPAEVFAHADVAGSYLTDLTVEVVRQVLLRDPVIRAEDARRIALAAESLGELRDDG